MATNEWDKTYREKWVLKRSPDNVSGGQENSICSVWGVVEKGSKACDDAHAVLQTARNYTSWKSLLNALHVLVPPFCYLNLPEFQIMLLVLTSDLLRTTKPHSSQQSSFSLLPTLLMKPNCTELVDHPTLRNWFTALLRGPSAVLLGPHYLDFGAGHSASERYINLDRFNIPKGSISLFLNFLHTGSVFFNLECRIPGSPEGSINWQ